MAPHLRNRHAGEGGRRNALTIEKAPSYRLFEGERYRIAAIVLYGRCFKGSRRDKFGIPSDWIERLPANLQRVHADILARWDAQFAQAAEDWKLNAAMAEVAVDQRTGEVKLTGIGENHARLGTLSTLDVEGLRDLADRLGDLVDDEMKREAVALLELGRRISFF